MKNIIVIGGNRGVGLEVVKSCLNLGYRVAFIGKENQTLFTENQQDRFFFKSLDLRNTKDSVNFIKEVIDKWKKVDGVIFYAGITPVSSLLDCTEEVYDDVFSINLKSIFFITQIVLKNMITNGGGSLIYFGSAHMDYGQIDRAAYAITKGALNILSSHIAHHFAKYQIRSNYIVMGWTDTDGEIELRKSQGISPEELQKKAASIIPMGRMLKVNDPIPTVLHFLSDESSMITGSVVRITGGEFI